VRVKYRAPARRVGLGSVPPLAVMTLSFMPALPSAADILTAAAAYSQPLFSEFMPYGYFIIGFAIAPLGIWLIIAGRMKCTGESGKFQWGKKNTDNKSNESSKVPDTEKEKEETGEKENECQIRGHLWSV